LKTNRRIPELTGVRGMAILLVVVWHFLVDGGVEAFHPALRVLRIGFSGVDLFFVLSGFLIGGILLDTRSSVDYFRPFLGRRFFRIVPLYTLCLLVFLVGRALVAPDHVLGSYFHADAVPMWPYFLFMQNLSMAFSQKFGFGLLAMTWSLAVDQQFYLLAPLVVRILSLRATVILTVAAVLAAPAFRVLLILSGNRYYGPYLLLPARLDALGLGILLAVVCRHRATWEWFELHVRLVWAALAVLSAGMLYFAIFGNLHGILINGGGYSWVAAFYTVLLLAVLLRPECALGAVFRSKGLMHLGKLSFAVYLLHQGINVGVHYCLLKAPPSSAGPEGLATTVLAGAVTYAVASASWKWLEGPIQRASASRFPYDRTRVALPSQVTVSA
jgi:peptidoglycan/LPS O-acetylase OafA/YrhL